MQITDIYGGLLVKVVSGRRAGAVGQVRKVNPDKNTVALLVEGKIFWLNVGMVEVLHHG